MILTTTAFAGMVEAKAETAAEQSAKAATDPKNQTYPTSELDFSVYDTGDSSAGYSHYSAGKDYVAVFSDYLGNGSRPVVTLVHGNFALGYAPSSRVLGSGSAKASAGVSNATSTVSGSKVSYEAPFGSDTELRYVTAWNGIKEDVILKERPTTKGDLTLHGTLYYDTANLSLYVDGEEVTDSANVQGSVEIRDESGATVFGIPRGVVQDSSTTLAGSATEPHPAMPAPKFAELTYYVKRYGDVTLFDVIVPGDFLQDPANTPPFVIDPSLGPNIVTSQTYTGIQIDQTSDLNILAGGTLTLRNVTFVWQGNHTLTVQSLGKLVLDNTTMNSIVTVSQYHFISQGTLDFTNSLIKGAHDALQISGVTSQTKVKITLSTITNSSTDCIFLNAVNVAFTFLASLVTGCAEFGLNIYGNHGTGGSSTIEQDTFNSTKIGFNYPSGTAGGHSHTSLTFTNNTIAGFNTAGVQITLTQCSASHNGRALAAGTASTFTASTCTLEGNAVGVWANGASVTLTSDQITNSSVYDVDAVNSNVAITSGNWQDWVTHTQNSALTFRHTLDLTIVDAQGTPRVGYPVFIRDVFGSPATPLTYTGSGGTVQLVVSHKRIQPNGAVTFYTPNQFELGLSPRYTFWAVIEADWNRTLYATGDADNDTIPDSTEDNGARWYTAAPHAQSDAQVMRDFTDGSAITPNAGGPFLNNSSFANFSAGTYRIYFQAWTNLTGASIALQVDNATGAQLLAPVSFNLNSSDTVYASPNFTLSATGAIRPQLVASGWTDAQSVILKSLVFVREQNVTGAFVGSLGGQLSDPISDDTDHDGARDSVERRNSTLWWEVENLVAPGATRVADANASSGAGVLHPQGDDAIAEMTLPGAFVVGHDYVVWIRARAYSGGSGQAVRVTLSDGVGGSSASELSLSGTFEWIEGPLLTLGSAGTPHVLIEDATDPNLNDGVFDVLADEMVIADMDQAFDPDGRPSNPLEPDTDFDGEPDGPEDVGFHTSDIVQGENTTYEQAVSHCASGITFNSETAEAHYQVSVRYDGLYRIIFVPSFLIGSGGGSLPSDYLEHMLDVEVTDISTSDLVEPASVAFAVFDYSNYPAYEDSLKMLGSVFDARFNLTVGDYAIVLKIDSAVYDDFAAAFPGRAIAIKLDSWHLQKYRLDAMTRDTDSDGVLDGVEFEKNMQELNPDSDYDYLSDVEEVFSGTDGYRTNPNLNDTDHDGVLDGVETGVFGDSDSNTVTDPTNPDSDGDGIPDGWIDGWAYLVAYHDWRPFSAYRDGLKQPWEGEDLNGDGLFDPAGYTFSMDSNNNYASTGGETDPLDADTDGDTIPDGWELADRYFYSSTPHILDPLDPNDATADPDSDGLSNVQEYEVETNPYYANYDADALTDGQEVRIWLRTDIANGLFHTSGYTGLSTSDWMFFDPDPFLGPACCFYNFSGTLTNTSASSGANTNWTRQLASLSDGGLVVYNQSEDRVYVWDYDADTNDEWDGNHVLDGLVHVFVRAQGNLSITDLVPVAGWKNRELRSPLNPWVNDSDGDGLRDGLDGPPDGVHSYNRYAGDEDGDRLIDALDTDSDGDGIPDGTEEPSMSLYQSWSPARNETDPYWNDTDGDGTIDSADLLPLDQDNDNLTGYVGHSAPNETIEGFGGIESLNGTDPQNPDTDGDALGDGVEDANRNGVTDGNETSPVDKDTDDDGLFDGFSLFNVSGTVVVSGSSVANISNASACSLGGVSVGCFDAAAWFVPRVGGNFTVNLTAGQYWVYANVSDRGDYGPQNRSIRILLDGWPQLENLTNFTVGAPNWANLPWGLLNVNTTGTHNLSLFSSLGAFYLANLSLVPVHVGELSLGTDPRKVDTDQDGLQDGTELGLRNGTVVFDQAGAKATNPSILERDLDFYFSNPLSNDTDGDWLVDGKGSQFYNGREILGENWSATDPSSSDTDGDHLSDLREVMVLGSSPTNDDTDGDGLLDVYEPMPLDKYDNDSYNNIHDSDSNADSFLVSDYNSTVIIQGVTHGIQVVLRTNVSALGYVFARTWIAVDLYDCGALSPFVFDQPVSQLPSGASHIQFNVSTGVATLNAIIVTTFEGYPVFQGSGNFYVELPNGTYARYRAWNNQTDGTQPPLGNATTHYAASGSNFRYREVLNWSAVLDGDSDHDGLANALDSALSYGGHTCDNHPDCDGDGLADGYEYYHIAPGAVTNPDFDGDGLGDGYEVFGTHTFPDMVDSDLDGLWDGNVSYYEGGAVQKNYGELSLSTIAVCLPREGQAPSAVPQCWDYDGDGLPDGWEVRWGLDPKSASDNVSDTDDDGLTAAEEYLAYRPTVWNESLSGPWWAGTNPTLQDTDSDGMPDSFEVVYLLNARSNDASGDPDNDQLTNLQEYTLSKTDLNWTDSVNGSWPWWLATDPFSADTDEDGWSDRTENYVAAPNDMDGDGLSNGIDNDSDDDGLSDALEIGGWWDYTLDHDAVQQYLGRVSASADAGFDPEAVRSFQVTSNPYTNQSDSDGISDYDEWLNGSDPSSVDTDLDGYADNQDLLYNETSGLYESAATMQEFDPPWIIVHDVVWTTCPSNSQANYDGCLAITFEFWDSGAGLSTANVTYLGQYAAHWSENSLSWFLDGLGQEKTITDVLYAPASMYGERDGTYKFALDACDNLGNCNSTIYAGGREFKAATDWAKSLVQKVPGIFAEQLGYVVGLRYGFMSGWQDLVQGMDDLVHGRVDFGAMIGGIGKVFDPRAWGQMYDSARLDFMKTLSMAADPYTPTPEDLANLATDEGIFWMLDDGAGQTNSSNWLRFAKGNWDGLKDGHAAQQVISLVASFGWGVAFKLTETGATLALAFAQIGKIIGSALKHVIVFALTRAQAVLRPIYYAVSAGIRSVAHVLRDGLVALGEKAGQALENLRQAAGGFGASVRAQVTLERAIIGGALVAHFLLSPAELRGFAVLAVALLKDAGEKSASFLATLVKDSGLATTRMTAGQIERRILQRFDNLLVRLGDRSGELGALLFAQSEANALRLMIASARDNLQVALGEIGEVLSHPSFVANVMEKFPDGLAIQFTSNARGALHRLLRDLRALPDLVGLDASGAIKALAEVKSVSLETFRKNLDNYMAQLEKYKDKFQGATLKLFFTTDDNIKWLLEAAARGSADPLAKRAAEFLERLKAAGYGDAPLPIEGFGDAVSVLRPPPVG